MTGPPGAGKSTLARPLAEALGMPVVAKDDFKETLFRTLPADTVEASRALSAAAWDVLFHVLGGLSPPARVVQLHLTAPRELLLERYRSRPRDPGHQTEAQLAGISARIDAGEWAPLDLPDARLIEVDATRDELLAYVLSELAA